MEKKKNMLGKKTPKNVRRKEEKKAGTKRRINTCLFK
jgi:hypothetical protein